jgi:hypothetical protein
MKVDVSRPCFFFTTMLIYQSCAWAQSAPQPPCGRDPVPDWPALDDSAVAKLWSRAEFGRDWTPPACTGWTSKGFTTLVSTAARFRYGLGAEGLLRHIGAISELAGMRYWSTTHKQWQMLIPAAWALTGLQSGRVRQDFAPDEMKEGNVVYFEQEDNLTGKGVYRMRIVRASPDRLVFNVENVGTMRYLFVPVFHPGDMQSVYFLDRESDNIWRFYSMLRTGADANGLVTANDSSAINRAVAFYRWLVGIPGDQEPPAAR